jgi:hypothetical protein
MTALELIEQVRALDAEVVLDGKRLVVRGRGQALPEELQAALREHKAEVMVALGASAQMAVEAVLNEIRPYLPPALKRVSNENLLVLVNWSILHAWNRSVREVTR